VIATQTYRLCVITDAAAGHGLSHVALAALALEGGARMIQLRDKSAGLRQLLPQAREIARLCREYRACFIVNDRLDLALAADAQGVHLGQDDLPPRVARAVLGRDKLLGVSTHSLDQARRAVEEGADYVGIGPIFHTATKTTGYAPLGLDIISSLRASLNVPLIAIGGITLETVEAVMRAGASGVAVIGAVARARDPAAAVRAFLRAIARVAQG